ncbi:metal ABC transporter substrate-binding protein [Gilliamella sp. B2776]|nr:MULTISPECIES: metal ABC transporter substrate-binding protein [unclassified Gilliamella]MCX8649464.1 metal ABC transporter substrate-binding protein [Gilliamella sp. B2779]MCX8654036.1 metal ABC transporter substrate-binding protein [Gilliamella sp. B2737]MCX8663796.1 metal ABC transporter substrate-binding protein [Gilliamella sp. B2887]MCX8691041.1 metal ABC transporter substrate-binding protein [Gilliamella sp. B2776]MCX8697834.1 metal ABC transporter substrate-binding protein [Gilliamel
MKFTFFKRRKTLLSVILSSLLALTGMSESSAAEKKFKVVTTFTIIQDIAQNVAGDAATVESITKVGAEIHEYDPTPQDITKALSADLVLWNGLNLELWFKRFFEDIKDVPSVIVTKGIEPMPIQEGSYKGNPNPHAWMSPTLALTYIENIRAALVKYDPKNASVYNKNAQNYVAKIKALDAPLRERLAKIPETQRWLVTSEGAFSYLARDYNLKEAYLWPINAEQQGTPKQVKNLIDLVRSNKIPVIFSESTISDKPAKQVSKETGAKYGGVLYVDSLSKKEGPVPTYIDLLKVTVETIAQGFEKS